MKSIVTPVIEKADMAGRFLNEQDVQQLEMRFKEENERLEAVAKFNAVMDKLAQEAGDFCFETFPELKQAGNAADTPAKVRQSYADIKDFMRVVSYCLVVRSTDPIHYYSGLDGRYFFDAVNVPRESTTEPLRYVRDRLFNDGEVSPEMLTEIKSYFDYLIKTLS